jgi:hypothetical protein
MYEKASLFSRLTFKWVYPIMESAASNTLSLEDFKGLRVSKRIQKSAENMNFWYEKLERKSLIKSIIKSFGREYMIMVAGTLTQ